MTKAEIMTAIIRNWQNNVDIEWKTLRDYFLDDDVTPDDIFEAYDELFARLEQ